MLCVGGIAKWKWSGSKRWGVMWKWSLHMGNEVEAMQRDMGMVESLVAFGKQYKHKETQDTSIYHQSESVS